jgi:hypothetical protein
MSSKRQSKTAIAAVMALMPSLLYSGLARATCVQELNKLKAAPRHATTLVARVTRTEGTVCSA